MSGKTQLDQCNLVNYQPYLVIRPENARHERRLVVDPSSEPIMLGLKKDHKPCVHDIAARKYRFFQFSVVFSNGYLVPTEDSQVSGNQVKTSQHDARLNPSQNHTIDTIELESDAAICIAQLDVRERWSGRLGEPRLAGVHAYVPRHHYTVL